VPKLLVVEHEEQVRGLLQTVLARSGYDVRAVRTAEEAIQTLRTSTGFEAVISETLLPGMDGHDLAQHVATHFPSSKVIFVTASHVDCERCPHNRSCPWIAKPFVPKELVRRVAELIGASPGKPN
jgi:DNA-binding response OmpR family regulator